MSKRNQALDLLKFIFAVIVVLFHSSSMASSESEIIFPNGRIGVEFFFIVSGCMMASSAMKRQSESFAADCFSFMKRKYLSLMPNVIIAQLIAFCVYHVNMRIFSPSLLGRHFIQTTAEMFMIKQVGIKLANYNGVTWYLSAMLFAMALLFPLVRKYKETFFLVIAPLSFFALFGWLFHEYQSLSNLETWSVITYKGNLRAILGIIGGTICYRLQLWLRGFDYTKLGRLLLTVVEWLIYIIIIIYIYCHGPGMSDYVIFIGFMIAVTITVSEVGYDKVIFRSNIFDWLGKFSFSLYLGHSSWRNYVDNIYPESWSFITKFIVYIFLSVITGLVIMYSSIWLRKMWNRKKSDLKKLVVIC